MLYYEAKVTFSKLVEASTDKHKKTTDYFLCHSLSYSDTEERIREHVAVYQSAGEMPEIDIKKVKYVDVILNPDASESWFFKGKIEATVLDGEGEMAREKKINQVFLVQAADIEGAVKSLNNIGLEFASDAKVVSVQRTNILDYLDFYAAEN